MFKTLLVASVLAGASLAAPPAGAAAANVDRKSVV